MVLSALICADLRQNDVGVGVVFDLGFALLFPIASWACKSTARRDRSTRIRAHKW